MIEVVRRNVSWIVRVAWVAMALLPNALTNDRLAVSIAGWSAWSLVAIATWLEHPISLTVVRAVSPVVVAHLALGLPDGNWEPARIAGVTCGVVALMVVAGGDYGSRQVQAGAYGDEVRHLLRVPAPIVTPAILGWSVCVALGVVALSVENVVASIISGLVCVVAVVQVGPKLHRLSRRWLVKVPAGWVVHDDVILSENLLLRTHQVISMTPAPSTTQAFDLTGYTRGVPLEITLRESTDVRLSELGARLAKTTEVVHASAVLVAPTSMPSA